MGKVLELRLTDGRMLFVPADHIRMVENKYGQRGCIVETYDDSYDVETDWFDVITAIGTDFYMEDGYLDADE